MNVNNRVKQREEIRSIMSEVAEIRHEIRSLLRKIYGGLKIIVLLCLWIFLVCLVMVAMFK